MKNNFEKSMEWLGELEGLKPHEVAGDPGGKTSAYGITQAVIDEYYRRKGEKGPDVSQLTIENIYSIMWEKYWGKPCDHLEDKIDFVVFQLRVNVGAVTGIRILQRALGVKDDGLWGMKTATACDCADTGLLIEGVLDRQVERYYRIVSRKPSLGKFLPGWINRVKRTAGFIRYPYIPPEG